MTRFRPELDGFDDAHRAEPEELERAAAQEALSGAPEITVAGLGERYSAMAERYGVREHIEFWLGEATAAKACLGRGLALASLDYYRGRWLRVPRRAKISAEEPDRDSLENRLRRHAYMRGSDGLRVSLLRALHWQAVLLLIPARRLPRDLIAQPISLDLTGLGLGDRSRVALNLKPPVEGGADWIRSQTAAEWETLRRHLDAGRPWPICIVDCTAGPLEYAYAVAFGYEQHGGELCLHVYDPLRRPEETRIRLSLEAAGEPETVVGFFCEPYLSERPPVPWWERAIGFLRFPIQSIARWRLFRTQMSAKPKHL